MENVSAENVPSPSVWAPGVSSSYSNGWNKMKKYLLELLLITIIYLAISSLFGIFTSTTGQMTSGSAVISVLGVAYNLLLASPLGYGVYYAGLKAARNDQLKVSDMFKAFQNYSNVVLASLLVMVIVVIGFILLIVPGVVFACKLTFVPYLVMDRKMGAIDAVKESWRISGGHAWTVFGIGLLGIPISIAGLICLGVGVLFAMMWINLAMASLYHAIVSQNKPPVAEGTV